MCPITMTAVMAAVGTAVSAVSASQASNYNAKVAEAQAVYSSNVAANEYTRVQRDTDYAMGRLRARRGASGRSASGSALDVLNESFINFQLDALNAKYEGEVQAVGYRNQAAMHKYQGKMELVKGVISLASGQLAGQVAGAMGPSAAASAAPTGAGLSGTGSAGISRGITPFDSGM